MPGTTRSPSATTDSTMDRKCSSQVRTSTPRTADGGGPPVLFTRMSTGPRASSIRATFESITERSPRSHSRAIARPPDSRTRAAVASAASSRMSATATVTPSAPRMSEIAPPSPPPAPCTSAIRLAMPRFTGSPPRTRTVVAPFPPGGRPARWARSSFKPGDLTARQDQLAAPAIGGPYTSPGIGGAYRPVRRVVLDNGFSLVPHRVTPIRTMRCTW